MSFLSIASWVAEDDTTSAVEFVDLDTTDATSLRFELHVCSTNTGTTQTDAYPLRVQHAWAGGPNASAASKHCGGSVSFNFNANYAKEGNAVAGGADYYMLQMGNSPYNRPANNSSTGTGAPNCLILGYLMNPNSSLPKTAIWDIGWQGKTLNNTATPLDHSSRIGIGIGGLRPHDANTEACAAFTGIRFSTPDAFTTGSRIIISKMT
tara:strand:+ start:8805 stop:9428 length:624 start_codon:yes stop_codon:yes gene_type:complete